MERKNDPLRKTLRNTNTERKYTKVVLLVSISFILVFFSVLHRADAATLYFSPSSGSYKIGQTFSVSLYLSSVDQAVNASQGTINFPPGKLQVTGISKTNSILSIWVEEPTFRNSNGTITYAGILPNPGFNGRGGQLLTITFRVADAGSAGLHMVRATVLANDGSGTQVLETAEDATFTLGEAAAQSETRVLGSGLPLAPGISSQTHPDSGVWYRNPSPKFIWSPPSDVSAVRILYDRNANSIPSVPYSPPILEKQLNNLADGSWYFHAQYKNANGWGSIAHFRFQIDTIPPAAFSIQFPDGADSDTPRPKALFGTTDAVSGLDHFRVKIGAGDFFTLKADSVNYMPYALPLQGPGEKTLLVQAFDGAGNFSTASAEFTVISINSPTVTEYPKELGEGDTLKIAGYSYPDATVRIFLERGASGNVNVQDVKTDANGNFSLAWDKKLKGDVYKFWADVTDSRGARSNPTENYVVVVNQPVLFRIGILAVTYMSLIISLLVVIAALLFLGWTLFHRFLKMRRRVKKDILRFEDTVHKAFAVLEESVEKELKILEKARSKRELTEDEEHLLKQLKKTLDATEKIIKKEVADIEHDVEY